MPSSLNSASLLLFCCCLQILELAVSAVLDHVATAAVLECSSVFDVPRIGQTQLGITGLSPQRTFRCAHCRKLLPILQ
jgi:hypothetical protein